MLNNHFNYSCITVSQNVTFVAFFFPIKQNILPNVYFITYMYFFFFER